MRNYLGPSMTWLCVDWFIYRNSLIFKHLNIGCTYRIQKMFNSIDKKLSNIFKWKKSIITEVFLCFLNLFLLFFWSLCDSWPSGGETLSIVLGLVQSLLSGVFFMIFCFSLKFVHLLISLEKYARLYQSHDFHAVINLTKQNNNLKSKH